MTIRTILSIIVSKGLHLHQLDVSNAFLNGDLEETMFMVQLQGFVDSKHPTRVY